VTQTNKYPGFTNSHINSSLSKGTVTRADYMHCQMMLWLVNNKMAKTMWHWSNLRHLIHIFLYGLSKTTNIMPEWTVCGARFETWNLQNTGKCYQLDSGILQWLSRNVIFKASHAILLKTGAVHLVKNTEHVEDSALLEYAVSLGKWFPVSSISVVPSSSRV